MEYCIYFSVKNKKELPFAILLENPDYWNSFNSKEEAEIFLKNNKKWIIDSIAKRFNILKENIIELSIEEIKNKIKFYPYLKDDDNSLLAI